MISSTILHSYPSFKFHPFLKHPSHAIPLKPYPPISNFRNTNHTCKALFTDDAPFAAAIGACMFTSLLLPVAASPEDDEDADSAATTTDARLAVMGILSFIPYFNWLVCTLLSSFSILPFFVISDTVITIFTFFAELGFRVARYWQTTLCCLRTCLYDSLSQVPFSFLVTCISFSYTARTLFFTIAIKC